MPSPMPTDALFFATPANLIPTIAAVILGLLINLHGSFVPLRDAVIGAAAGYVDDLNSGLLPPMLF